MIYMVGGAGYENFGDELMVRAWLDYFARELPDTPIIVDGASASSLHLNFSARYPNFTGADLINQLSDRRERMPFWDAVISGATFFDRGGFDRHPQLAEGARRLLEAETIHIHGGGYLNIHFPRKGFILGLAAAAAKLSGARLVGTGLGLMPLPNPVAAQSDAAVTILESFHVLETRDPESAEFVRSVAPNANVISGIDDTFLADMKYDGAGSRLHLSVTDDQLNTPVLSTIADYVRQHRSAYEEVIFWLCARNDHRACAALRSLFPDLSVLSFSTLIHERLPVARGDHMLTVRFHPHVIAGRGGAVGAFHSSGAYYDVKHGSIAELGSGFINLSAGEVTPDVLRQRTNHLVDDQHKLRAQKLTLAGEIYGRPVSVSEPAGGTGKKSGAAKKVRKKPASR